MIKNKNLEGVLLDIWRKNRIRITTDPGLDEHNISDAMRAYENSLEQNRPPMPSYAKRGMRLLKFLKWASIPAILTALILILELVPKLRDGI